MTRSELQVLLEAEVKVWAAKPYAVLSAELADVVAYGRGEGEAFHQFEVEMLELEPDFARILISVDDGGFRNAMSPPSRDVIVYSDGRVEV